MRFLMFFFVATVVVAATAAVELKIEIKCLFYYSRKKTKLKALY